MIWMLKNKSTTEAKTLRILSIVPDEVHKKSVEVVGTLVNENNFLDGFDLEIISKIIPQVCGANDSAVYRPVVMGGFTSIHLPG